MGKDLVRHRQDYHGVKKEDWPTNEEIFPEKFLTWQAVPEDFDVKELLEFNVKVYGARKHQTLWTREVSHYINNQEHKVIFVRPVRKDGKESVRWTTMVNGKYGTKKTCQW